MRNCNDKDFLDYLRGFLLKIHVIFDRLWLCLNYHKLSNEPSVKYGVKGFLIVNKK
jgi:hypothetical protein